MAGWLASAPPAMVPAEGQPTPARARLTVSGAGSDIEEQASRLQARMRREMAYTRPERNPFQFEPAREAAPSVAPLEQPGALADAPAAAVLPLSSVTLAGIATDRLEDRVERTAILSSVADVLLVRTGDEVLGRYRVGLIEDESVELISLSDGSTLRLSLAVSAAR